jgi:hypothetical protein
VVVAGAVVAGGGTVTVVVVVSGAVVTGAVVVGAVVTGAVVVAVVAGAVVSVVAVPADLPAGAVATPITNRRTPAAPAISLRDGTSRSMAAEADRPGRSGLTHLRQVTGPGAGLERSG